MKLSQIVIGEAYDAGTKYSPAKVTVLGFEGTGLNREVQVQHSWGEKALISPRRIRRPWSEAVVGAAIRRRADALAEELRGLGFQEAHGSVLGGVWCGRLTEEAATQLIARLRATDEHAREPSAAAVTAVAREGEALVHFDADPVNRIWLACGLSRDCQYTDDPAAVTCPACQEWIARNIASGPDEEAEASEEDQT